MSFATQDKKHKYKVQELQHSRFTVLLLGLPQGLFGLGDRSKEIYIGVNLYMEKIAHFILF